MCYHLSRLIMNWKISNDDTGAASNDNDNNGKDDAVCKSTSVIVIDWRILWLHCFRINWEIQYTETTTKIMEKMTVYVNPTTAPPKVNPWALGGKFCHRHWLTQPTNPPASQYHHHCQYHFFMIIIIIIMIIINNDQLQQLLQFRPTAGIASMT